ncbi:MAG: DUF2141 domain-containing protein [Chlorobi bacterium]|nr:DUF2141 domain-containing protein [Chlorobiota bacterium]MBM3423780.1 DUF2141 domain-containing protein [Chlorobiota bacterium]
MKTIIATVAFLVLTLLPPPRPATAEAVPKVCAPGQSGCITVYIRNLKKPEGMLGILLFSSKNGFPDNPDRAVDRRIQKITGTSHDATFENIPYGTYAISVLHDENSNGKMDKTFIGIPREGFGVSNNPKIRTGPPGFSEALFSLDRQQTDVTVIMKYF